MSAGQVDKQLKVNNDLGVLAPAFRASVQRALADCYKRGLDPVVYETNRSQQLQEHYFARGRTIIPPTKPVTNSSSNLDSWHGYGLAVDVISRRLKWDAGEDWFAAVATIFKKHGCTWGGDRAGEHRDLPHFQWHLCRPTPSDEAKKLLSAYGVEAVWKAVGAIDEEPGASDAMAEIRPRIAVVIAEELNLRPEPSTEGSPIKTVQRGTAMEVLDAHGNWLRVRVDGTEGFVHGEHIEFRPNVSVTADQTTKNETIALWMLSDQPIEHDPKDTLGFKAYTNAIAALITDERTDTPLTIAINGPWGSGKSTLAKMISNVVSNTFTRNGRAKHSTCWFNAWMHDDATDIAAAFASAVAQEADLRRNAFERTFSPLPYSLLSSRDRHWCLLYRGTLAVSAAITAALLLDLNQWDISGPESVVVAAGGLFNVGVTLIRHYMESAKTVREFVQSPHKAAQKGAIEEVRKQLSKLMAAATRDGQRFVIFVDDLERCRPPRSVDLLEVVNQLIAHKGVVTVIMADLSAVATAAEVKYQDLVKVYAAQHANGDEARYRAGMYGRSYLQKIVQVQFDLPSHTRSKIEALVANAKSNSSAASKEPERRSLARFWRKRVALRVATQRTKLVQRELDKAVDQQVIDQEALRGRIRSIAPDDPLYEALIRQTIIKSVVGDNSKLWDEAVGEAVRYFPLLPRSAKRLLNRLRLVMSVAHERGMLANGSKTTAQLIGRWAVLWERWPEVAHQVSIRCRLMKDLEDVAGDKSRFSEKIKGIAPVYLDDDELRVFCEKHPPLSTLAEAIVYLDRNLVEAASEIDI